MCKRYKLEDNYLFGIITWMAVSSVICSITVLITTARSTLKIEATNLYQTMLNYYHAGCSHIPEGINLQDQLNSTIQKHEKLGSHFLFQWSKHYLIYRIEFWYTKVQHLHFYLHVSVCSRQTEFPAMKINYIISRNFYLSEQLFFFYTFFFCKWLSIIYFALFFLLNSRCLRSQFWIFRNLQMDVPFSTLMQYKHLSLYIYYMSHWAKVHLLQI